MNIRHLVIMIDTEISCIDILLMRIVELKVYIFQKLVNMMKVEDIVAKVVLNCLKHSF